MIDLLNSFSSVVMKCCKKFLLLRFWKSNGHMGLSVLVHTTHNVLAFGPFFNFWKFWNWWCIYFHCFSEICSWHRSSLRNCFNTSCWNFKFQIIISDVYTCCQRCVTTCINKHSVCCSWRILWNKAVHSNSWPKHSIWKTLLRHANEHVVWSTRIWGYIWYFPVDAKQHREIIQGCNNLHISYSISGKW